jgi:hypothetical protein
MDSAAAPAPPDTLATWRTIMLGLRAALGLFGLEAAQAVLMHRRIGQLAGRIERMLARFRAGRLWRIADRPVRLGAFGCAERTLPRRFGWLVRTGGHRAAVFGVQIETLLRSPEMAELLAVAPQAVRILRPLCRALAVDMPGVSAPAEKDVRERRIVRRRPKPKPEPFRIPLPRGVLTAARRQGYGKLC